MTQHTPTPNYFQLACDITRKRAEELTRACFHCHEDNSGTVLLCALHAKALEMLAQLRDIAEWVFPGDDVHNYPIRQTRIARQTRALLREIEGQ